MALPAPVFARTAAHTFEWAELCLLCNAKTTPPGDGSLGDAWTMHVCGRMEVPWAALEKSRVVPRGCYQLMVDHYERELGPEVGPYLPWQPPAPKTVFDLTLWSPSERLRHMMGFGERSEKRLVEWFEHHGLVHQGPLSKSVRIRRAEIKSACRSVRYVMEGPGLTPIYGTMPNEMLDQLRQAPLVGFLVGSPYVVPETPSTLVCPRCGESRSSEFPVCASCVP